jgi:hypothetical protein
VAFLATIKSTALGNVLAPMAIRRELWSLNFARRDAFAPPQQTCPHSMTRSRLQGSVARCGAAKLVFKHRRVEALGEPAIH